MSSLLTESLGLHIQRPPSGDNQHAAIELQGRQLEEITIDEKRLITLLSHVPTGPFYVWTSMPPAVDKTKPYSNSIQVPGLVSSAAVSR